MRKFIVSDLHGNGEVYDSIMAYLDNISVIDDVELYINGDLFDRGIDSFRMLEDVVNRIVNGDRFSIHYLAGNHELMMYQALLNLKKSEWISPWCDWLNNGGWFIECELFDRNDRYEKCLEFRDFLGKLRLYHVFSETVNNNPILLVHAQPPKNIVVPCNKKICDNDKDVFKMVWTRKDEYDGFLASVFVRHNNMGKKGYLTISGHTPVDDEKGFEYNPSENYFNIDGGCAGYAIGRFEYEHVPLVEIGDGFLTFLIFNHNNEIVDGYFFDGKLEKMNDSELEKRRLFLNSSLNGNGEENKKIIKECIAR